jgi:hypothetical protein
MKNLKKEQVVSEIINLVYENEGADKALRQIEILFRKYVSKSHSETSKKALVEVYTKLQKKYQPVEL